jgi:hypothetical protein
MYTNSDGEALTATLTATGATIEYAADLNTLEAGRIAFKPKQVVEFTLKIFILTMVVLLTQLLML